MKTINYKTNFEVFKSSFRGFNWKMLLILLLATLLPSIYTTLRVYFVNGIPDSSSLSIAAQISWLNILFEILTEALLIPLFAIMSNKNKCTQINRSTKLFLTFSVMTVFGLLLSVIVFSLSTQFLQLLQIDKNILEQSSSYIKIEVWAIFISLLSKVFLIDFTIRNKRSFVIGIAAFQVLITFITDFFFISNASVSLQLGVNGVGYSNILISSLILVTSLIMFIFIEKDRKLNLSYENCKNFFILYFKQGSLWGLESLVRNLAFTFMVLGLLNSINNQGLYWVANNFIWSWLLMPILTLGTLIKTSSLTMEDNYKKIIIPYITITTAIVLLWFICIPSYKPFIKNVMNTKEGLNEIFNVILILLGFYVLFAYNNIFDTITTSVGKPTYILFQSIVTNLIVYGTYFILYKTNVWTPTLNSIAIMFGIGLGLDSLITYGMFYWIFIKRISLKWGQKNV